MIVIGRFTWTPDGMIGLEMIGKSPQYGRRYDHNLGRYTDGPDPHKAVTSADEAYQWGTRQAAHEWLKNSLRIGRGPLFEMDAGNHFKCINLKELNYSPTSSKPDAASSKKEDPAETKTKSKGNTGKNKKPKKKKKK